RMKDYIKGDEWNIIEEGFHPEFNKISESIFSLGNGRFGQRGNFEEYYSGETLQGNYIAGVYYPDKTKVGWWKNGYPEYFAKVLNAINWLEIDIVIGEERLDLATCKIIEFRRILHMKEGFLERYFIAELASGKQIKVHTMRFCSMYNDYIGAIRYSITSLNFDDSIHVTMGLDGDVKNCDSNYGEKFWDEKDYNFEERLASMSFVTKKTLFEVDASFSYQVFLDNEELNIKSKPIKREKYVGYHFSLQ